MKKKKYITTEQRKLMSEIKDYKYDLSVFEVEIIKLIRSIGYGSVAIHIIDGIPQRTEEKISKMLVPESFK